MKTSKRQACETKPKSHNRKQTINCPANYNVVTKSCYLEIRQMQKHRGMSQDISLT